MAYSILVVDDEALTLRTIGRALQAEGYDVTVAMSAKRRVKNFADGEARPRLAGRRAARYGRHRGSRQIKKANPRHDCAHDERVSHGRPRGGIDEAWRVRLPDQAVPYRRSAATPSDGPGDAGVARARARNGSDAKGPVRFWTRRDPESPRCARCWRWRARPPSPTRLRFSFRAKAAPARKCWRRRSTINLRAPAHRARAELRRPARYAARERTLRLRARRIHRRTPTQRRSA